MSPRRGGGCLGDAPSCPPRRPVGGSARVQPGAPQPSPAAAAAWRSRVPAAAPGTSQPPPPPGTRGEGGGRPPGKMKAEGGDHSMINLSVQQVLSLWAHGTVLRNLTGNCCAGLGTGCGAAPRLSPSEGSWHSSPPQPRGRPALALAALGPGQEGVNRIHSAPVQGAPSPAPRTLRGACTAGEDPRLPPASGLGEGPNSPPLLVRAELH